MKRFTSLVMAILVVAISATTVRAQNTRYFDVNDNAANSGVVDNTSISPYSWDASTANWNPNANGTGPGPGTTAAWVNGDNAVFSAGADASGHRYFVNIGSGTTASSAVFEEGTVVISSGSVLDTGGGTAEVLTGATLETIAQNQFDAGIGVLKLSGGRLLDTNPSMTAQNLLSPSKTIEINGTGTIEYSDGSSSERQSNISGNVITGTGGTPSTGGAGTLVKYGPDALVYSGVDTGGGVFNWQLNSFAKLVVKLGAFRIKGTGGANSQIDERLFGAVPVNTLADAITLDGGGIGATQTVTLDAKRGITITANGGYFDQAAAGNINVPGPLTAAPVALLTIGSPTSNLAPATLELSNPNNVTTFQGNVVMLRGTLQLDSSLNVARFSGTASPASAFAKVQIAGGKTLTVGSDNQDTSFDGTILDMTPDPGSGAIFTKVGTGTLTLNTFNTALAAWTNTGGININDGTIKYNSARAGFANTAPVSIGATGKLNMNGVTDTIGSLSGRAGAIVDMKDTASTAAALTFAAAAGSTTYSGTIIGGGNLTKAGTASTAVQILAGNTTLNTVAVNAGTLRTNATMTASGGVTVASAGTFGGTGTVVGAVANNGTIAPGDAGVGTLNVAGNLTDGASSHWAIELSGPTADKIAVTGNINLTAADSLDVTGAGSGSTWLIGTYTGSLTGTFDNVTAPYTVSYAGGNITLNAPPTGLLGDFNNDGKVDAGDYCTWKKNEGTYNALVNDNGLGTPIGSDHYNLWRANFGNPPGAGSSAGLNSGSAVPEPASFGLLAVGLAAFCFGRRGRVVSVRNCPKLEIAYKCRV